MVLLNSKARNLAGISVLPLRSRLRLQTKRPASVFTDFEKAQSSLKAGGIDYVDLPLTQSILK